MIRRNPYGFKRRRYTVLLVEDTTPPETPLYEMVAGSFWLYSNAAAQALKYIDMGVHSYVEGGS
jgi:hypothetical protein